jgi:hypothetical protein
MGLTQRILDQLRGILSRNEIEFLEDDARTVFTIPFESTACHVEVYDWNGGAVVQLRGIVLENVDAKGERRGRMLERLNALNRDGAFGTLWLTDEDPGTVILEHHLLGDELDEIELMHALRAVATRADELDDELSKEFETGERWSDVEARSRSGEDEDNPIDA